MAYSWTRNSCVGRVLNRKALRSTASPSASANWSLHRRGVLLQQIDELAHVVHLREIFRHRGAPLAVHAARGQPGNKRPHCVAEGSWDLVDTEIALLGRCDDEPSRSAPVARILQLFETEDFRDQRSASP
jgi:hypothetical protein